MENNKTDFSKWTIKTKKEILEMEKNKKDKKENFFEFKRRGQIDLIIFIKEFKALNDSEGHDLREFVRDFVIEKLEEGAEDLEKLARFDLFAVILGGCRDYVNTLREEIDRLAGKSDPEDLDESAHLMKLCANVLNFVFRWEAENVDGDDEDTANI